MHARRRMIDVSSVTKRFGHRPGVVALNAVSLTIPAGRICAVVGPNGAGKSTLFALIMGFLRASSGSVTIAGSHPRDYMREQGVGYLPDRFSLPAAWPVARAFHALAEGGTDEHLASFGLAEVRDRRVGELSRGMLQRLGLAQALAPARELVILDEPAEGLDPVWRLRLRDRIAAERAAGRTVILASHDVAEVERIADTVVLLDRGEVRDVLELKQIADATSFRLVLEAGFDQVESTFPGAQSRGEAQYLVTVADTAELNRRLAVLIELGGRVTAVAPENEPLEERVRRTLAQ